MDWGPPLSRLLRIWKGTWWDGLRGQNSCRNHASKFPDFRGPVRRAPRQGCGQSGCGEGKRNRNSFSSRQVQGAVLRPACRAWPAV